MDSRAVDVNPVVSHKTLDTASIQAATFRLSNYKFLTMKAKPLNARLNVTYGFSLSKSAHHLYRSLTEFASPHRSLTG